MVILAGYPEEMDNFLRSNAGLARRFEHTLTFPDYAPHELGQIFAIKAKEAGFGLDADLIDGAAIGRLLEQGTSATWRASAAAGNARVAERMYHLAYEALVRRSPTATAFALADVEEAVGKLGQLSRQWAERQPAC